MDIMKRVAENVNQIRMKRGLTQRVLADKVRIHRIYVAQIEGQVGPPPLRCSSGWPRPSR